jgi:hypothetical protein
MKPMMHCNGHCVLLKNIKAQEKQESPSGVINWGESLQLFVNKFSTFSCMLLKKSKEKSIDRYSSLYKENYTDPIFHPPLV